MILGRFVDAVATDLFTGGNRYARQEARSITLMDHA